MLDRDVGSLGMNERLELIGTITDRDLALRVLAAAMDPTRPRLVKP